MTDLLQCVPDDRLAELIQSLYSKQLEEYEGVEAELKRTEESYNEMLALQSEADRQIQKATLQANELIVQLAASQQELKQLDDEMTVAVKGRLNAKKKLERRCLEFETLKLRLSEVLGPDYKPNISF
jgi:chromosome segregation ATPase